jgi:hypothetical protein
MPIFEIDLTEEEHKVKERMTPKAFTREVEHAASEAISGIKKKAKKSVRKEIEKEPQLKSILQMGGFLGKGNLTLSYLSHRISSPMREKMVPLALAGLGIFLSFTLLSFIPGLQWVFLFVFLYFMFPNKTDIYRSVRLRAEGRELVDIPYGITEEARRLGMSEDDIYKAIKTLSEQGYMGEEIVHGFMETVRQKQRASGTAGKVILAEGERECPYCEEIVKPGETICPHCGKVLPRE